MSSAVAVTMADQRIRATEICRKDSSFLHVVEQLDWMGGANVEIKAEMIKGLMHVPPLLARRRDRHASRRD